MTEQQAIDTLRLMMKVRMPEEVGALRMAERALQKQIPKKPTFEGDGYWEGELVMELWVCPTCECDFEIDVKYSHCPECGQAIDWSEEVEE